MQKDFEIIHVKKCAENHAVMRLVTLGAAQLLARFEMNYPCGGWDQEAVAAMDNGVCVGVQTFSMDKDAKVGRLDFAHVDPGYREKGLFLRLFDEARKKLGEKGVRHCEFTHHEGNERMAAFAKRVDARPYSHTYRIAPIVAPAKIEVLG